MRWPEKTQKLEFKNKIASNEVIKSQVHLYLQDWSIHDGDVTPFAKKDVQLRYATWTNLYKSSLLYTKNVIFGLCNQMTSSFRLKMPLKKRKVFGGKNTLRKSYCSICYGRLARTFSQKGVGWFNNPLAADIQQSNLVGERKTDNTCAPNSIKPKQWLQTVYICSKVFLSGKVSFFSLTTRRQIVSTVNLWSVFGEDLDRKERNPNPAGITLQIWIFVSE